MSGDVEHESLAIEPGAYMEGHCKRITETASSVVEDLIIYPVEAYYFLDFETETAKPFAARPSVLDSEVDAAWQFLHDRIGSPPASMPCPTPSDRCHWLGSSALASSSEETNKASSGITASWSPCTSRIGGGAPRSLVNPVVWDRYCDRFEQILGVRPVRA